MHILPILPILLYNITWSTNLKSFNNACVQYSFVQEFLSKMPRYFMSFRRKLNFEAYLKEKTNKLLYEN